jgi:hypothetical protein
MSGAGRTSLFSYYDPLHSPKSPVPIIPPAIQPRLPTIPLDQYLARKAASAQGVQTNFPLPRRIETSSSPRPLAPVPAAPLLDNPAYSWEGIQMTPLVPPSPEIAVGPSDALLVVNSSIAQYTRSGVAKNLTTFQQWFSALFPTVCPSGQCLLFDPCIRYDQLHGRFLFLATSKDSFYNLSYLLLSVSNGATYDSGWKSWALDASLNGASQTGNWADFWRLGFDNVAVYLSGNMYNFSNAFQYAKIRILKKSDLYNAATTTLNWQDIWNLKNEDGTTASSLDPVHQRGKPSATSAGLFINASDTVPADYLTVWKINDPLATPVVANRSTVKGLWPYNYPAAAPQLGGRAALDTSDSRLLKAVYRNGFVYTARNTGYASQPITVTFDLIDTSSMQASSQSRLLNSNSFYPSFDVPASVTPGTAFASNVAGTTTAPDGTLTYAGISMVKPGEDYFDVTGGTVNRWGDYFGGAVDPVNGGLWVSGEYAKPRVSGLGVWGTWAAYFPWSTNQMFNDVNSSSPYFDFINVLRLWQITGGCSATAYCPDDTVTRGQLSVFLIRAMLGDNFSFASAPYFTDVPSSNSFFPYIQKMRELGITAGCSTTTFCPDAPLTRSDAAILIIRGKLKALYGDSFPYPTTSYFTDVDTTGYAFPFVQKMRELSITAGCGPTQYCPDAPVSRAQMAVFIVRAFLN